MHAFLSRGLQRHENASRMDYHRYRYYALMTEFFDMPFIKRRVLLSPHMHLVWSIAALVKEYGENDIMPILALKRTGSFYLVPWSLESYLLHCWREDVERPWLTWKESKA